jgi:hypothetical protein
MTPTQESKWTVYVPPHLQEVIRLAAEDSEVDRNASQLLRRIIVDWRDRDEAGQKAHTAYTHGRRSKKAPLDAPA